MFDARGMALEVMDVHQRAITNRSRGVRMLRRWVQASFASAPRPEAPLPPPPPPPEPAWARRKREADARKAEEEKAKEREAEEARRRELAEVARAREAVAACDREGLERALLRLMREGRVGADELAELSARESSEAS
jgi:methyltransferase-like protein 6